MQTTGSIAAEADEVWLCGVTWAPSWGWTRWPGQLIILPLRCVTFHPGNAGRAGAGNI
jgi:hypothetical protein